MNQFKFCAQDKPVNLDDACRFVENDSCGALNIFVGTVRNKHEGNDVVGITYDIHKKLADKEMLKIFSELSCENENIKVYVSHAYGYVPVGENSIVIAVSTPHRQESFECCRQIIEEIKKRLPVWKKEHYVDGETAWLPGHSLVTTQQDCA